MTSEICSVFAGWNDIAKEDCIDNGRVYRSLCQGCLGGSDSEICRRNTLEGSAEASERRSFSSDDENVGKLAR